MTKIKQWFAVFGISLIGITSNQGAVYQVSSADNTAAIQAVLDQAVNGDTVQFAAGTYTLTNELVILNKGITLQGMGKATGTILQRDIGSPEHRIIRVENAPVAPYDPAMATTITGFTVKNGKVSSSSGGNILMKETPYSTIDGCIIEQGTAAQGGGISLEVGGMLSNSIIRNNTTINGSQNQGGGIYMRYGANYVHNSIIYDNWADVGGGIGMKFGGAESDPSFSGDARNRITNSTITGNTADGIPAYGIYGGGTGSQLEGYESFITDSIVTFNLGVTPDAGKNDIDNVTIGGAGTLTVTYTDANVGGTAYAGTGNIATDPLFVGGGGEPWNTYKLQTGSPALSASSSGGIIGAVLDESMFGVPEPSTLILLGLAGMFLLPRQRT